MLDTCLALEALTNSVYDVAVASLHDGPQRQPCINWLLEQRRPDGLWGESRSWHDCYIATYATAVALYTAQYTAAADYALKHLAELAEAKDKTETLSFGVIIAALDRVMQHRLHRLPPEHPPHVQFYIQGETEKWKRLKQWSGFYERLVSTAGFIGENVYADASIDLKRYLNVFQLENGSISGSPGASALVLLEAEDRGMSTPRLRAYVESLNPFKRVVGVLDSVDFFAIAWSLMYYADMGEKLPPSRPGIEALARVAHSGTSFVCAGGSEHEAFPYPPDLDTTAGAMLGLQYPLRVRQDMLSGTARLLFDKGCYITFAGERNPSVSTNIHVLAAWPGNPHTISVLNWLRQEMQANDGALICKWHVSPYYPMCELARLVPNWNAEGTYPLLCELVTEAARYFIETQHLDGGWGITSSTCEETAYAVIGLCAIRDAGLLDTSICDPVLELARAYLEETPPEYKKLWLGKTLYCVRPIAYALYNVAQAKLSQLQPVNGYTVTNP